MDQHRCYGCMQPLEGDRCPRCGWTRGKENEAHQLPVGTVLLGRYEIGRVLGQGGFGITYLGWDIQLQTAICIKEYFPNRVVSRDCGLSTRVHCYTDAGAESYRASKERFLREGRILAQFRDIPEIVSIYGYFEANDTVYIVMEYIRGMDLAHYIQSRGGRLGVDETFRILWPIMTALSQVHKGGLVHRDIAPDNIMLHPRGGAKLLDFGAARMVENADVDRGLDRSTEAIVKHGFAPMEQYQTRGSLGPWTDVYAMCATVWYCLTGQIPPEATTRMLGEGDIDWRSVPGLAPQQCAALEKGMAVRAKDRYPSMDALLQALTVAPAVPTPPVYQAVPPMQVPPSMVQVPPSVVQVPSSGVQMPPRQEPTPPPIDYVVKRRKLPRWVKICAAAVPLAAVAVLAVLLTAGPKSAPQVGGGETKPQAGAIETTAPTGRVDLPGPTEADPNEALYQQACALMDEGRYGEAYPLLYELAMQEHEGASELLGGFTWMISEQISDDWHGKFDLRGNLVWYAGKAEGGYTYTSEMEYDDQGREIKYVYRDNDPDYPYSHISLSFYNEKGQRIRKEDSDGDGDRWEYLYEYDAEGRISTETYRSGDYSTVYYYTYTVSDDGRYRRTDVTESGQPYRCEETRYDEEGRTVYSRYYYYGDYGSESISTYKYDDNGYTSEYYYKYDVKSSDEYDEEYTIYYTSHFDEDGMILSRESRYSTGEEYTDTYFWNEYGINDRIEQTHSDGTVKVTELVYKLLYNGEEVTGY